MPVEYCRLLSTATVVSKEDTQRDLTLYHGYEVKQLPPNSLINQLNVLGAEGWKMVGHSAYAIALSGGVVQCEVYVLMREVI